jgi:Zn ribbon nucleic-acid-binding protein
MKTGKCPKCNATTVYCKTRGIHYGSRGPFVTISNEIAARSVNEVDVYICISCGYYENYLVDPDRLQAIARDWDKVE